MIRLAQYSIEFNRRRLLADCNVEFRQGELTALIGRNGAGKSTVLRSIIGLETSYSGEIFVNSRKVADMSLRDRAYEMALVATRREHVPGLTCRQAVELGRMPYTTWSGKLSHEDTDKAEEALVMVGMENYADRLMETLSDGEAQKIMIARALAQDTEILLLDEPTSFLDQPGRFGLCRLLAELAHERGKCILFSTHEIDVAFQLCDSIALIVPGSIKCKPVDEMAASGLMNRYFDTEYARFDPELRRIIGR